MKWKEIEWKNFTGREDRRTPSKNACSDILNLDPRGDVEGDLYFRPKVIDFLTSPAGGTDTAFAVIYLTQLSAPKEVTVLFQKATTGSQNYIKVSTYPFWDGSVWLNQWGCINEIVSDTLTYATGNRLKSASIPSADNEYIQGTVYNVTTSKTATILSAVAGTPGDFYIDKTVGTDFVVGNTVLFMKNLMLPANLTANYASTDLAMHNVLNDLRVGFGGEINRMGLGIGYRKRQYHIKDVTIDAGLLTAARTLNKIITFPHLPDKDAFSVVDIAPYGATAGTFPYSEWKAAFLRVTAVLDYTNEYLVWDMEEQTTGNYIAFTGNNVPEVIKFQPEILFSKMDKRVTSLRFYLAPGGLEGSGAIRIGNYELVREMEIAGDVAKSIWTLGSDGKLLLNSTDYASNELEINYNHWLGRKGKMQDVMGYFPTGTDIYIKSWDQAITTQGKCFYMNPYIGERAVNKIVQSHVNENQVSMYDVATALNYAELEQFDNDDIVGMEILPNLNLAIFRQSSVQTLDAQTGFGGDVVMGIGCISRKSIVNFKDKIMFASRTGVYVFDGARLENVTDGFIKGTYEAISDTYKRQIIATRDPLGNCYRMSIPGVLSTVPYSRELLLIDGKGWFLFYNGDKITQYSLSPDDNSIKYLSYNDGKIKKIDNADRAVNYNPSGSVNWFYNTGWIDVAVIGEDVTSSDRFLIGEFWAYYYSSAAITVNFYRDGSSTNPIVATLPVNTSAKPVRINIGRGVSCQSFMLQLSGTLAAASSGFKIKSLGIKIKPDPVGIYAR